MIAPQSAELITAEWLQHVLDQNHVGSEVASFSVDPDFKPTSLIADVSRVLLRYLGNNLGPASLIVKFPTSKLGIRKIASSRGTYAKEGNIYRLFAQHDDLAVPKCYGSYLGRGEGETIIVMEDMSPARPISQLIPCSPNQAQQVLENIADIHSRFWADKRLPERNPESITSALTMLSTWGWEALLETFGDDLHGIRDTYDWYMANLRQVADHSCSHPTTLINGDIHTENLLFSESDGSITIVDWQIGGRGLAAHDVAFFLTNGLSISDRREHESDLLTTYYQRLTGSGQVEYSYERFLLDYRAAILRSLNRPLGFIGGFGGNQVRPDQKELAEKMFRDVVAAVEDHDPVNALQQLQ